jgi:uncharacterized protein YndB with AHSA1/START domain
MSPKGRPEGELRRSAQRAGTLVSAAIDVDDALPAGCPWTAAWQAAAAVAGRPGPGVTLRAAAMGWRPGAATATRTLRVVRSLSATPATVFAAWLDPAVARRWLFATATEPLVDADIDPRVRGAFRFVFRRAGRLCEQRGVYVEIAPPWRLAFTLQADAAQPSTSRVAVDIAPRRHASTLTVTHEGIARVALRPVRERWIGMLYGLDATLADGTAPPRSE